MKRRRRNPDALTAFSANKLALGAAALIGIYLFFKWQATKAVSAVLDTTNAIGQDVGEGIYNLTHTDANAANQVQVTDIKSALQAAGYPRVGSDTYNAIMLQFNRPDLVIKNELTGQGGG